MHAGLVNFILLPLLLLLILLSLSVFVQRANLTVRPGTKLLQQMFSWVDHNKQYQGRVEQIPETDHTTNMYLTG